MQQPETMHFVGSIDGLIARNCTFPHKPPNGLCGKQAVCVVVDHKDGERRLLGRCVIHTGKIDNHRNGEILRVVSESQIREIQ